MSDSRPKNMREFCETIQKRISVLSPIVVNNGKIDSLGSIGFQIALHKLKKVVDENNKDASFTKENLIPFIYFLAEHWEFIKGTDWSYTCSPDHPFNLLLVDIAAAIDPKNKHKVLMPTLMQTSSDITLTELNALSLKDFMLTEDNHHYIEVKPCFEYAEDDAIYKYTYTVNGQEQKLGPEEVARLSGHSKEALEHYKMINRVRELKNSQNDIGKRIEELRDALRAGSIKGSGRELDSGAAANEGVLKFSLFLDALPATERERLFKTTYDHYGKQVPFEELWTPLKRQFQPGEKLSSIYCVHLISLNFTSFLQQHPEIYLINSEVALRNSKITFESAIASPSYVVTQSYGTVGRERQLNRVLDHPLFCDKAAELYRVHLERWKTLNDTVIKLQEMNNYLELLNRIRLPDQQIKSIKNELTEIINMGLERLASQVMEQKGANGYTILHEATRKDPAYFRFIIKNLKPDVLAKASAIQSNGGWSILHAAAKHLEVNAFIEYINLLPQKSLDQLVFETNAGGWTGLHMAIEQSPEGFKAFVEKVSAETLNRVLGQRTNDNWTALATVSFFQKSPDSFKAFIAKLDPLAISGAIHEHEPGAENTIFKLKLLAKTQVERESPKAIYVAAMALGYYSLTHNSLYSETALWFTQALRQPDAHRYYHDLPENVRNRIETFASQNNHYELLILHAKMQPDPVKYYQALAKNVRDNIEKFALKNTNYSLILSIAELSHSPAVIDKFNTMTKPLAPEDHLKISRLMHSQLDKKGQPSRAEATKIIEDALTHAYLAKNLIEASTSLNAADKNALMAAANIQITTLKQASHHAIQAEPVILSSFLASVKTRLISAFVAVISLFYSPTMQASPKNKVKLFSKSHHFLKKHPKAISKQKKSTSHSSHKISKHRTRS